MNKENMGIIIAGAGPAGGQAALALRRSGYEGRVLVFGEELCEPCERPPLSKDFITGEDDRVPVLPGADLFPEKNIELFSGVAVTSVDAKSRQVLLSNGEKVEYDRLLLATGARVRTLELPGAKEGDFLYMRTFADAMAIKSTLRRASDIAVVGGGFIGLELAASARKLGCKVTVIEAGKQLMGRVVPPIIADYFAEKHRSQGIDVRIGAAPVSLRSDGGKKYLTLSDGSTVEADAIIVGIGVIPNDELAKSAGLDVDNGVLVDEFCRTSDPSIFAAGDVTRHKNPILGQHIRLEAWQPAINQASVAAENMLGAEAKYVEVPWVWTDQFDINFQLAGFPGEYGEVALRGTLDEGDFTLFLLLKGTIRSVITINRGSEMVVAKRAVMNGKTYLASELEDESVKLNRVLRK